MHMVYSQYLITNSRRVSWMLISMKSFLNPLSFCNVSYSNLRSSSSIIIPRYGNIQCSHVCLCGLFTLETRLAKGWESLSRSQLPPQWQRLPFFQMSIKLIDGAYLPVREKWTKPPVPLSVDPYGQNPESLSGVHQLHITDKAIEMGEKSQGCFLSS